MKTTHPLVGLFLVSVLWSGTSGMCPDGNPPLERSMEFAFPKEVTVEGSDESGLAVSGKSCSRSWVDDFTGNTVLTYLFESGFKARLGSIYDYRNYSGLDEAKVVPVLRRLMLPNGELLYDKPCSVPYWPTIRYTDEEQKPVTIKMNSTHITFWSNHTMQVDVWGPVLEPSCDESKPPAPTIMERIKEVISRIVTGWIGPA